MTRKSRPPSDKKPIRQERDDVEERDHDQPERPPTGKQVRWTLQQVRESNNQSEPGHNERWEQERHNQPGRGRKKQDSNDRSADKKNERGRRHRQQPRLFAQDSKERAFLLVVSSARCTSHTQSPTWPFLASFASLRRRRCSALRIFARRCSDLLT